MKSYLGFKRVYSEEHMIEINIGVAKTDIKASVSCYTQIDKLYELSRMCDIFVKNSLPFNWSIGTTDYSYFEMNFDVYGKRGHIKVGIIIINNKNPLNLDYLKCEFFIIIDLGQVENLGKGILELCDNDFTSVTIEQG